MKLSPYCCGSKTSRVRPSVGMIVALIALFVLNACTKKVCPGGSNVSGNRCVYVAPCSAPKINPSASWAAPLQLSQTDRTATFASEQVTVDSVRSAVDASGRVTVVWVEHSASKSSLLSRTYSPDKGWDTETKTLQAPAGDMQVANADIAAGQDGSVVVAWNRYEGVRWNMVAARYTSTDGWSDAKLLESDDQGNAGPPVVAIDVPGEAYVAWPQHNGSRWAMRAARFVKDNDADKGWASVEDLDVGATADATLPRILAHLGDDGGAWVVWQEAGEQGGLRGSEYFPGSGWSRPAIASKAGIYATQHQIGYENTGIGIIVSSNGNQLVLNTYQTGKSSDAGEISPFQSKDVITPSMSGSSQGSVLAVWRTVDDAGQKIQATSVNASRGWGADIQDIATANNELSQPSVAFGAVKAVVAWHGLVGGVRVPYASIFDVLLGWGAAEPVAAEAGVDQVNPVPAVDCAGGATYLWIKTGAGSDQLLVSTRRD